MRRNTRGFTLVEAFLVAASLGIVLMTIFSSYSSGIRIWRATEKLRLVEDRRFYVCIEKIKRELMGYIRDFEDVNFAGDKEELSFPSLSDLNIVQVTYLFDKNRNCLLKKVIKFSESLKERMDETTSKLFDAEDVQFSYLFYDSKDKVGSWISGFSEKENGVPEAIRIDIKRNNEQCSKYVFIPR